MADSTDRSTVNHKSDLTKKPIRLGGSLIFATVVVAIAALVASFVHKYITTPIQPGHVVPPGNVLSKCGLNFFSRCDRAYLEVQSGMVSYYQGKELAWVLHGNECRDDEVKNKACLDGLEFKKDRTLWLGGEPIQSLEQHSETGHELQNTDHLVPWPFSEEPKIKSWQIAANKLKSGATHLATEAKKTVGKIRKTAKNMVSPLLATKV